MTSLLPRLDREQTQRMLDEARDLSVGELAATLPRTDVVTTASALGGVQVSGEVLTELRAAVVSLARAHGYPDRRDRIQEFDGLCARLLHSRLGIAPHEASDEAVWSHLTVCWLMDVAVWRWEGKGAEVRFRGDVNRNTFRRLWWRAEIFGAEIDLTHLGEDEFVNIMERPTLTANRRLCRSLARQFLDLLRESEQSGRMMLMRDAGKWLIRLTPIIDFNALDDDELDAVIAEVLAAAAGGLPLAEDRSTVKEGPRQPSPGVEQVSILHVPTTDGGSPIEDDSPLLADLFDQAIHIARRAGQVNNRTLREAVPDVELESADARRVLQDLVDQGRLRRRGKAKGTHYVLPADTDEASQDAAARPERNER